MSAGCNGAGGRGEPGAVTRRCIPFTLPLTSFVLVLATGCLAPTAFDAEGSSEVGESTGEVSEGVTSGESSLPSIWTTTEESGSESVEEIGGCAPGSVEVCAYEGPAPTLQVGSCRAASRVCDEDGRWGACAGEVTPRVEDCGTAVDEDCDGQVACTGEVTWVRSFGQPEGGAAGSATAEALTIDSRERIWLTGGFSGSLTIGGEKWEVGTETMFMARLFRDGAPEIAFADDQSGACGVGTTLAADGRGMVALGASYCGKLKLAAQAPVHVHVGGWRSALVGGFSEAGDFVRDVALRSEGGGRVDVHRLAFDGEGNLWIAGRFFAGAVAVGEVVLDGAGASDGMVVKLRPDGTIAWARGFGDAEDQEILDMDVDGAGNVWLVGGFAGSMQFAGGSLKAPTMDPERSHMFVVKLDAEGAWQWGRAYGSAEDQVLSRVRVGADGEAVLAGSFTGPTMMMGDLALENDVSDAAIVVARLDAQGEPRWAQRWPCVGPCVVDSLVLDGAGQSVVSTGLEPSGAVVIGESVTWAPAESEAGVVAKLDREGALMWEPRWVAADVKLALGPTGSIYMTGSYAGAVRFGEGAALNLDAGADGEDVYVARARP